MTDREMLDLAAKTAELWDAENNCIDIPWDPLNADGDALRLSAKLGININYGNHEEGAVIAFDFTGRFEDCEEEGDPYAATRRAIVRAAAALTQEAHDGSAV